MTDAEYWPVLADTRDEGDGRLEFLGIMRVEERQVESITVGCALRTKTGGYATFEVHQVCLKQGVHPTQECEFVSCVLTTKTAEELRNVVNFR